MTEAMLGYDTGYEIWDSTLTVPAFVAVGEVTMVAPGSATADRVEATHMKSPGRRREYIAGLIDSGEASFEINWVPGSPTDELIRRVFETGETVRHRITFPNKARVTYEAQITGYEKDIPVDDRMTATVSVSVSGTETWDEAA
ncbi:phage tail tube protein [Rhizobium sp. PP-F2F-G48]|uniref:phage tail tube protein n=1 Tax=Rhizobium sp. PP-F2F-G48 TaxID=2135651 RepID=UPI0010431674|nr:phage tail tube protein [Rhizobium sp. PP-F2F-G48]TCM56156.1 phage tail tube protein [Rhizobium sp. PP-F2F-G48]